MDYKQKLQQLALERQNLQIAMYEINGAMKLLEQQILETEPESGQILDKAGQDQQSETAPSKK